MKANAKFKPYIHSVKYSKNNIGEIICSLGDWSIEISNNYWGNNINLCVKPKFEIRDILDNPDITLEQILINNNGTQFLRYLKIEEKEKFKFLKDFFNRFKEDLQKISKEDVELFLNCYKDFLINIKQFNEDTEYLLNQQGEIELYPYRNRDLIKYYYYRFPDVHYDERINSFLFTNERHQLAFINTSPLLSLEKKTNFSDLESKWYIFDNFTASDDKKVHIPRTIIKRKNDVNSYSIIVPEKIDKQSIIITFNNQLINSKPILDELVKKDIIFEYYPVGEIEVPKYYETIENIEKFSDGKFTREDVVSNILKSRKVSSYHGFTAENKEDWKNAIVEINKILKNDEEKEVLFFRRNQDLNVSLDLEMTSPKIILTDFFKEKYGEYIFQLYLQNENDITVFNQIMITLDKNIITDSMIRDICRAFEIHEAEQAAFENK
jgi:hypothetical protein